MRALWIVAGATLAFWAQQAGATISVPASDWDIAAGQRFLGAEVSQQSGTGPFEDNVHYLDFGSTADAAMSTSEPSVTAQGQGPACFCGAGAGGGGAKAVVNYGFMVAFGGPTTFHRVPVFVTYSMNLSVIDEGAAEGQFIIFEGPIQFPAAYTDDRLVGSANPRDPVFFTKTFTYQALPNVVNTVRLDAEGNSSDSFTEGGFHASVDPFIQIDPAFLRTHPGYSLELSPGVLNTPPAGGGGVPEPASWALMLTGFAGMGAALRARRKLPGLAVT